MNQFLSRSSYIGSDGLLSIRALFITERRHLYTSADALKIEQKWRTVWKNASSNIYQTPYVIDEKLGKKYILSMFPYPSGTLHMGHVRVYTISDALARYHRLRGYRVLHPMGWDAFGLPAENAAIERGIPPDHWTQKNIEQMRQQLDSLFLNFDWNRELATCEADYYRWTQWIFVKLYRAGLAYRKEGMVNWDPVDQTVLADEQVDANGRSWRSGALVERKPLTQWYLKITAFQDELLKGLEGLAWPEAVKEMQRNWVLDKSTATEKYLLRDWLISRQRYWGTPIPIIHCSACGTIPVPEDQLPVKLPESGVGFTGKGGSPLEHIPDWHSTTCPSCGNGDAKREVDTMDTFMDSSWYFLRYCCPDQKLSLDSPISITALRHWMPVDVYIGGIEHAILHLLYARFIHKFLSRELGLSIPEPFSQLITQGLVEGLTYKCPETGKFLHPEELITNPQTGKVLMRKGQVEPATMWTKMSKSKYNGVDPSTLVSVYGADVLRLCILFKAPPEVSLKWNTRDIAGPQRWLVRLLNLTERILSRGTLVNSEICEQKQEGFINFMNRTIHEMEAAFDLGNNQKLNLTVSNLMKFTNEIERNLDHLDKSLVREAMKNLAIMLHPIAPCTSAELLQMLGIANEAALQWPSLQKSTNPL